MNEVPLTNSGASKSKKHFPWTWLVLAAVLFIPALFIGSFLATPFMAIHEADTGFRKAKKTIDPEELRAWALEEIKNHSNTNGFSQKISSSEIPNYLKNLYTRAPEDAWVNPRTIDSEACVMIMWGGGFFHWGLDIGPTNYMTSTNSDYRPFMWHPGIYYRREAAWGLL